MVEPTRPQGPSPVNPSDSAPVRKPNKVESTALRQLHIQAVRHTPTPPTKAVKARGRKASRMYTQVKTQLPNKRGQGPFPDLSSRQQPQFFTKLLADISAMNANQAQNPPHSEE